MAPRLLSLRPVRNLGPLLIGLLFSAFVSPLTGQTRLSYFDPAKVAHMRLPNGLTVLAMEDHTTPTVAYQTYFKVGSRHERPGITGLSHLFEHMMFNGSRLFKPKQFDIIIEGGGGFSNASTGPDFTEYHEECSSSALDVVLQLEADRMRALKLDRQNIEQERLIVKEERRVNTDNSIIGSMYEMLWNSAIVAHPYHWDVIGFMKDIDAITLADAKEYFKTFYAPNNAVVAVVGDFSTANLFALMRKYFSTIPAHAPPPPVINAEPVQRGERRIEFDREAELPAVMVAYHIGSNKGPDDPAFDILAAILASGESSRLYQSLVYKGQIASSVGASNESREDPGLFTLTVQVQPGHSTVECEQAIYSELADIAAQGVTAREIQKAKNMLKAAFVGGFKTDAGRADLLAQYEASWGKFIELMQYLPRHDRVTTADVKRIAGLVFSAQNRTVVTLHPLANSAAR